jgi:integrase
MGNITLETVKSLKPGKIAWDGEVKGFGLRCQQDRKIYLLKTRYRGRPVWLTIGDTGTWTPKIARDQASEWKRELRAGVEPDKLRASARGQPTIDGLIDRYIAEHIEPHLKPLTVSTFKGILERHIRPAWGKRLVTDISSADVARLHHKMRKTPRTANQTIAVASKMFALAEAWQMRPLNSNPCRHLRKYKENARTRFYDDKELQAIGKAVADLEAKGELLPGVATAIRLAAMTGLRLRENLYLRWGDVDLKAGALEIRDAKAGSRRHPIGAATIAFLSNLKRAGPWVCQGVVPDRHLSTRLLSYGWQAVRERAKLKDARFHDLRHSYGTFAGATGANAFLVKDAMGHKTLAMTGRYVGKDADPMRQLVDSVSGRVAGALTGKTAEVRPLNGGAE